MDKDPNTEVDQARFSYLRYVGGYQNGVRLSPEPFEGAVDIWAAAGAKDGREMARLIHAHHACAPDFENISPWKEACAEARGK